MITFKQFIREAAPDIKDLADRFKEEYEGEKGRQEWGADLKTCSSEAGNCSMVTETFIDWLREKGVKAKSITGNKAVNRAWAEVKDDEGNGDSHTAAVIGDTVVDFTAKQFDSKFPVPRIYTVATFKREWDEVS